MPLSSLTLHDCFGLHMPPTLASPKVLQDGHRLTGDLVLGFSGGLYYSHAIVAANIFACYQYGDIVMMRILLVERVQLVLPAAKAIQILLGILREIQLRFRIVLLQLYDAHHNYLDGIANAGILVQGGHHIHNGQQIADDVLVKCGHCRIRHNECLHVPRTADRATAALHMRRHRLCIVFEFRVRMLLQAPMRMQLMLIMMMMEKMLLLLLELMMMMASHFASALYFKLATRLPLQTRLHATPRLPCATIANQTRALALTLAVIAALLSLVALLLALALVLVTPVRIRLPNANRKQRTNGR